MHGGPSPRRSARSQAGADASTAARTTAATSIYSFVNRASKKLFGSPWKFAKHGQCGTEVSELLPHTAGIVDDICVHPLDAHRAQRARGVDPLLPRRHRRRHRPADAGELDRLRPGQRGAEPAGLHGAVRSGRASGRRRAQLVERLPAAALSGDGAAAAGAADSEPRSAAAAARRRCSSRTSTSCGSSTGGTWSSIRAKPTSKPASPATNWPPRCRPPPRKRSTSRRSRRTSTSCTASTSDATREYGTRCLIARRLVERGVRFVQLFLGGQPWDNHSTISTTLPGDLPADRPAGRGAGEGPEAARPARHDARPLGRRDRPAAGLRGRARRHGRPRPQRPGLLHLARRRRHQGRHDLRRRPTKSATRPPSNVVTPNDYQATILHLLGLDHTRLIYHTNGRAQTLTDGHAGPRDPRNPRLTPPARREPSLPTTRLNRTLSGPLG